LFPQLKRPIIFICNDFYGAALRPIKELVHAIKIEAASNSQLVSRLTHILREENISGVQLGLISNLVEECGGDARSCINTVQLLAQSNQLGELKNIKQLLKDRKESVF